MEQEDHLLPPLPGGDADPFASCEEGAVVRFVLADGSTLDGTYTTRARLRFLHRTGPGLPLVGAISGPYSAGDVRAVTVLRTRAQVREDAHARLRGERVPGHEPNSREDHEHRLQVLARAVAEAGDDWTHAQQLRRQFDDVADRVALATGKRAWMLAAAKWTTRSNAPPTMADLWVDAVASPSCFARPRPQDFDPDPRARRRSAPLPAHVRADPWSIPNMLAALRTASLAVRVVRLGDPPWDRGEIQVDMPLPGRSRFVVVAGRDAGGRMRWRAVWDGNDSAAGQRRHRRALRCDAYARMMEVLRCGRVGAQADLFGTRP